MAILDLFLGAVFTVLCISKFQEIGAATEDANVESMNITANEKWFTQYLDHFNVWNNSTFLTRYYEFDQFYRKGGPLLIEIGAETSVDVDSVVVATSFELAQKLHGKLIYLEHRYYGESVPEGFENFTAENLVYLTVEQALEDLAYFVDDYKKENDMKESKVAVFGCSYAGALATWFRYKFPHLVDAAWATSAPLRVTLDFYEYFELAGEVYANVSSECIALIRQGYREAKLLTSTPDGLDKVRDLLEGWECANATELNGTDILTTIRYVVSNQYSGPNHGLTSCEFLQSKNASTTPFEQLAAFVVAKSGDVCHEEDPSNDLAWNYQTCTEFGYSFTTNSAHQPFRDDYPAIDEDLQVCETKFGEEYNEDILKRSIERMNRVYGSTKMQASKVLSVHGTNDPWRKLGLYYQKNQENPVILIPGVSHCSEQLEYDADKAPQIKEARRKGMEIMARWLQ